MDVSGTDLIARIGSSVLTVTLACASQPPLAETPAAPPTETRDVVADTTVSAPASLPPARLELERRAREQLWGLELELVRVAHRLEQEGTPSQLAKWGPALADIAHDHGVLDQELGSIERSWHGSEVDVRPLAAMIEVLSAVGAQTMLEIDETLDARGVTR